MQNFWELLLVLSSLTGQYTAADVARLAEIKMKLEVDNEYIRRYESVVPTQLQLNSGIIMANVSVKELKKRKDKPSLISFYDLRGICLTHAILKEHITEFGFPLPPSNPVPDAIINQRAKFNGKLIWMGFKWSNSECLSEFGLNFE
jgi:hypothetical protein